MYENELEKEENELKKTKKKGNKIRRQQLIFVWAMLALPIVGLLVFYVYVNFNSFCMAFKNIDRNRGGVEYWTLQNFATIVDLFKKGTQDGSLLLYARNTLIYWLPGVIWGFPFSILLTYAFHKKMWGYKFFRILLYIPSIITPLALAGIFTNIIDVTGAFGYILQNVFRVERVPSWFQEAEYVIPSLLFYGWFFSMAGSYVVFSGAMANIDREIFEAAHMDGVSMWQELWYICIPLMWPTLSVTILGMVTGFFNASGAILLLAPNMEESWSLSYWIFDQVKYQGSYYLPSALGLCFTAITFPISLLVKKGLNSMFSTE